MRSDPGRGATIRSYAAFENNMRDAARSYWGEGFGKDSLSGKETNRFFLNRGGKQFADLSGLSGLDHPGDGRSMALLDFDRDGWQDLVVASANSPKLTLFKNEIGEISKREAKVVALKLEGGNRAAAASEKWSNRDGIGALITVMADGRKRVRHVQAGEGFSAQNSSTLLLPTGGTGISSWIEVRWPSGKVQRLEAIAAGKAVTFYENPTDSPDGEGSILSPYLSRTDRKTP